MNASNDKTSFYAVLLTVGACFVLAFATWSSQQETHRLRLLNTIFTAENNILKEEIRSFEIKPSYEQGYKDALIRVGGPQTIGAYADGWDDAFKLIGEDSGYTAGYHAAIQQFGYTKSPNQKRWLIPGMPAIDDEQAVRTASYGHFEEKNIKEPEVVQP